MVPEVTRGHPTPNQGLFGVIWGQNSKLFKPRQIIYQNEAIGTMITKSGFRGHPRSSDPESEVFRVIWGQNPKIFKPRQIIYQNEALVTRREAKKKRLVHQLPRAKREA